jgi:DNA-damage-inducible protein D
MKSDDIISLFKQFENITSEYNGVECWSARELQILMGYSNWQNFVKVIEKAKFSCENAGEKPTDHLTDVSKSIITGKKTEKQIDDILLTRYACYLIAQNGDARKVEILNLN